MPTARLRNPGGGRKAREWSMSNQDEAFDGLGSAYDERMAGAPPVPRAVVEETIAANKAIDAGTRPEAAPHSDSLAVQVPAVPPSQVGEVLDAPHTEACIWVHGKLPPLGAQPGEYNAEVLHIEERCPAHEDRTGDEELCECAEITQAIREQRWKL